MVSLSLKEGSVDLNTLNTINGNPLQTLPMASSSRFLSSGSCPLVGTVAGISAGAIGADDQYRRYRAGLTIGVHEHGSVTQFRRSIFYEVGRRTKHLKDALGPHADASVPIDASFRINEAEAANFEGVARRYSNFSPQWEMMDLSAIAERLAKGVAAQSVYGGVTITNMLAGHQLNVVALGTLDSPQTASTSSVFIPRTVDSVGNDHVFAVLVAAANGEGAAVSTDVLRLDANTNQPVVPAVAGHSLASACIEALRIVGANMEASGAGDLFAYAVTRGIHSVVSVVSHTDEGGFMRALLRHGRFRVPYGGVNQTLRDYPALPAASALAPNVISSWVDSIALKTAGLVAHCDPCVNASGGTFPSVFTASTGAVGSPGVDEGETTQADALSIGRQIAGDLGRFAPLYMAGLTRIFGLQSNSLIAESHFCTVAADSLNGGTDRHLQHKTVAPYFWVEPTSLIPRGFIGSVAESAGFGAMADPGEVTSIPTFEKWRELDRGRNANFSTVAFKMRSARTSGLVAALAADPAPLAALKLYQFDEDSVVLAGDRGPTNGDVPTKHAAADPLSSYLWVRGQSAIPAPAEFINTQSAYGAKYRNVTWDDDFDASVIDGLPEAWELEHDTTWRVTVPTAFQQTGPSNYADREARRARSRSAIALAQAAFRARAYGEANSPVIDLSNVPPAFDDPAPPMRTWEQDLHTPRVGDTRALAGGAPPDTTPPGHGPPKAPIPHHQPLRGAPFPGRGGAGAAPRPPPQAGPGGPAGPGGSAPPPPPPDHQGGDDIAMAAYTAAGGADGLAGTEPAPQQ